MPAVLPVAVNFVAETNVVGKTKPPNRACAPGTNPLPFSVKVNVLSGGMIDGRTEASVGYGFKRVTIALADAAGVAVVVTVTMTAPELGMAAGGIYRPPADIVPGDPVAPAGKATVQPTEVVVVPVTLSVN